MWKTIIGNFQSIIDSGLYSTLSDISELSICRRLTDVSPTN